MYDTAPSFTNVKEFDTAATNGGVLKPLAEFIDYIDKNVSVAKLGRTGAVVIDGQETNLRVIVFSSWEDYKTEVNRAQLEALAAQGHKVEIVWFSN